MEALLNHLWQSTIFAAAIAALCYALRQNAARTRYWLWLAASLKFAIPFSAFVGMGIRMESPRPSPIAPAIAVEQVSASFAPMGELVRTTSGVDPLWPVVMACLWAFGGLFVLIRWFLRWREIRGVARQAAELPLRQPIPVLSSRSAIEPGLFGIFRPVLLLPNGLQDRLTAEQFDAILTHELCHLRYRDNLTAALHMAIEALFWFHPLVWWIGSKLVEERERACDEAVLAIGNEPADYAQGIVNVCKFYTASPLPCVAGVSGADLRKRIREIMASRLPVQLTTAAKTLLAVFFVTVLAVPVAIGLLRAQTGIEYQFEVASIRPSTPGLKSTNIHNDRARFTTRNTSLLALITFAYNVQGYQVSGGPNWIRDDRFDIAAKYDSTEEDAKVSDISGVNSRDARIRARLKRLLAERFQLILREETKDLPIYALVVDRQGDKLKPSPEGTGNMNTNQNNGNGVLTGDGVTLDRLAIALSSILGRPVLNQTGSQQLYAMDLKWSADGGGENGPTLFTALTEQLGLKLESKKGPVTTYVIERAEKPAEN